MKEPDFWSQYLFRWETYDIYFFKAKKSDFLDDF